MRTLTSKVVKTGIKNGFTVKDFCRKYSIMGEGAFLEQLERAFPHGGSEQMLREIRQNEKNRRPKRKQPSVSITTSSNNEVVETKEVNTLEALKIQEASLSNQIIDLESQHKELAGQRRGYLLKLRKIQQKVDEICHELEEMQTAYEKMAVVNNDVVGQMNQISRDRAQKLAELTTVRAEIARLETTTIAVYEDCGVEIVEGKEIAIDPEIDGLAHRLIEMEICENLTIKQIRTLAKIITISRSTASKVEFIFDNSSLEAAFLASKPLPF
ncbi:MAG: hypothetical protein Q4A36_00060 [Candidatus Saccharibacteria bacterium]|nr:hypothetical protein [Candidatus Saccharibacteria bacterium]